MTDEMIDERPPADPMAKARAAKAQKAADAARAQAEAAERAAASASGGQPVVSSMKGRVAPSYEGEPVLVRVTPWGHAQLSTGGEQGFERYAEGAEIEIPEHRARQLFNKRYVEPVDRSLSSRWVEMNRAEIAAAMRAKSKTEHHMQHGVRLNEEWRSALTPGELSFSPRDEDFRA